jgi:hypothetical protein
MAVRLQDRPRALDARRCVVLRRSGPDGCMRTACMVRP